MPGHPPPPHTVSGEWLKHFVVQPFLPPLGLKVMILFMRWTSPPHKATSCRTWSIAIRSHGMPRHGVQPVHNASLHGEVACQRALCLCPLSYTAFS
jgi:hypothetical protein